MTPDHNRKPEFLLKRKVKQLTRQEFQYKNKIKEQHGIIDNVKNVNKCLLDENFFLKNFIEDITQKNTETYQNNIKYSHTLTQKIEELELENDNYKSINEKLNIKYKKSETYNRKLKQCLENNLKKINQSKSDYDILQQEYSELNNKYKDMVHEFRCFRRDIEQGLEESRPLLGSEMYNCSEYQIDKLKKYSLADFITKKKIDNKKSDKDNITFLFKPMTTSDAQNYPSLFSEVQNFLNMKPSTTRSDNLNEIRNVNQKIVIENQSLRSDKHKLENNVDYLNNQLIKKTSECEEVKEKLNNIKDKLLNLQKPSKKEELVTTMIGQPNPQLDIIKQEYTKLNMDYQTMKCEHAVLFKKYNDLLSQKDQDKFDENGNQVLKEQVESLKKAMKILDDENNDLSAHIESLHNTTAQNTQNYENQLKSFQDVVSKLESDVSTLKQYKEKYNELMKKTEMKQEFYVKKLNDVLQTGDNSDVKTKLDNVNLQKLIDIKEQDIMNVLDFKKKYMKYKQKYTDLQETHAKQSEDFDGLINQHDELLKDFDKVLEFNEELESNNSNLEELLKKTETELKNSCSLLNEVQDDSTDVQRENWELKNKLLGLTNDYYAQKEIIKDLSDESNELSTNDDKLNNIIEKLTNELESKNKVVESYINQMKNNDNDSVHYGEFAALEDDYNTLLSKYETLQTELQSVSSELNDVKVANEDLTNYNNELTTVNNELADANEEWEDAYVKLESKAIKLSEQIDDISKEYNVLLDNDIKQTKKLEQKDKEIKDISKEYNTLRDDEIATTKYLTELQKAIETKHNDYEVLNSSYMNLLESNQKLETENCELETKSSDFIETIKLITNENGTLINDNMSLETDLDALQNKYNVCEKDLVNCNEMYNNTLKELAKLKSDSDNNDKYQAAKYQSVCNDWNKKYTTISTNYTQLEAKYQELVIQNGELVEKINKMKPVYDSVEKTTEDWDLVETQTL